ncbi:uncharacterized protein LOC144440609 [Glandiceps talaboti]
MTRCPNLAVSLAKENIENAQGNMKKRYDKSTQVENTFKHGIETNTEDYDDRLYCLEQYTQGEPKEIESSCIHMEPKAGYERARKLLDDEYGNPYLMATSYTKQAEDWSEVKAEDKAALKEFALFLNKCENAMKGELHLRELDHHKNLQMLVYKLSDEK